MGRTRLLTAQLKPGKRSYRVVIPTPFSNFSYKKLKRKQTSTRRRKTKTTQHRNTHTKAMYLFLSSPGVGCFRKPQLFMKDGDVVTCEIAGIGAITNVVRAVPATYTVIRKHPPHWRLWSVPRGLRCLGHNSC